MYLDLETTEEILKQGDPPVYKVYEVHVPQQEGHLMHCLSVIYPGKVGGEYYMTKGHFHTKEDTAEVYLGLEGRGYLLLQTKEGDFHSLKMGPGTIAYISPSWAHPWSTPTIAS